MFHDTILISLSSQSFLGNALFLVLLVDRGVFGYLIVILWLVVSTWVKYFVIFLIFVLFHLVSMLPIICFGSFQPYFEYFHGHFSNSSSGR